MKTTATLLLTLAASCLPAVSPHLSAQTSTTKVVTVHSFVNDGADGVYPAAGLVQGTNGYFYGTTEKGGTAGGGTIFRINPAGTSQVVQHSFTNKNGDSVYPASALIEGKNGHFYGTTPEGGIDDAGIVFEMTPSGAPVTIYSFAGQGATGDGIGGAAPVGALVQGSDGSFYGATIHGGIGDDGTLFHLPPGGTSHFIHSFSGTGTEGAEPEAGLVLGKDGSLYGTTYLGGSQNYGTVFRSDTSGNVVTLHDFVNDGADGIHPEAALIQGRDGNFYGTTTGGGTQNYGTVFRMTPAGKITILHSFLNDGTDGNEPDAALLQGNDGYFYGVTYYGGTQGKGTVFRMNQAGKVVILHSFTGMGTDGMYPQGALTQDVNGLYYGTTGYGGQQDYGTVYRLTQQPVITSAATSTATVGQAFTYQITAADDPRSFGARGLFKGVTVNAQTGLISGTPTAAGAHTLTLQATNAAGTGTKTLILTVAAQ